jgi:hypothetical protein
MLNLEEFLISGVLGQPGQNSQIQYENKRDGEKDRKIKKKKRRRRKRRSLVGRCMPIISALRKLRQGDFKLEASLVTQQDCQNDREKGRKGGERERERERGRRNTRRETISKWTCHLTIQIEELFREFWTRDMFPKNQY